MRNKSSLPRATFESAWASVQETTKAVKEYKERSEKDWIEFKEWWKLRQEHADKDWIEFKEWMRVKQEQADNSMKAMQQELGGISKSNGQIAESYFVNSFTNCMQFAGQQYNDIDSNLKRKNKSLNIQGEFDLVMHNGASIAIIEIKYKAREKDIEDLLKQPLIFKQLYPEYANYDLYLGLAAFHFEDDTENISKNEGIAIIKQVGDNMVIYDEHLKIW